MKNSHCTKTICLLLAALLLLPIVSACGGKDGGETTAVTTAGTAQKTISIDGSYLMSCPATDSTAVSLVASIQLAASKAGVELKMNTSRTEVPEKEIVVGRADRSETEGVYSDLGEDGWKIAVIGKKVFIAGATDKALRDAVDSFITTFISGKSVIEIQEELCVTGNSPLMSISWKDDGEIIGAKNASGGYPRLYQLRDGTLLLAVDGMMIMRSNDKGTTWERRAVTTANNMPGCANAALFQTDDGTIYLGYRSTEHRKDGSFYGSIHVNYSTDNGATWSYHSCVYENIEKDGAYKGVWEPHFGMMDGKLTVFYANDSTDTTKYQNIEYKQWDEEKKEWNNRTIVCDGDKHKSRDGMPVWQQLSTGEYVCVIEAADTTNDGLFCVKLTWSADGKKWSTPVAVMRPTEKGKRCAAPYIVELPTGQLVISCQTDEISKKENVYKMATVVSDGTPVRKLTEKNFSAHDYPYPDDRANQNSMWNGMLVTDDYIYTCTSPSDGLGVRINRIAIPDFLKKTKKEG